jgi:hypothetical protein
VRIGLLPAENPLQLACCAQPQIMSYTPKEIFSTAIFKRYRLRGTLTPIE